jgi:hypothetical protein
MSDACRTHCHGEHGAEPALAAAPEGRLDMAAALISSLCLLHCIAVPALIALLPAMALVLPSAPWLHAGLLMLAVPASGLALWRGWRVHLRRGPAALGAGGITIMILALLAADGSAGEIALTIGGGLLVAIAHLRNINARPRVTLEPIAAVATR